VSFDYQPPVQTPSGMPFRRYQPFTPIELPDRRYALGVLWHPEEDMRSKVIGSLVEAARQEVNG